MFHRKFIKIPFGNKEPDFTEKDFLKKYYMSRYSRII